jgi:predicted DNA-binding transcriptional regulator YafY
MASAPLALPPLVFAGDEIDALLLGLSLVAQRGDEDLEGAAAGALAKIAAALPQESQDASITNAMLADPARAKISLFLADIHHAMQAERKLHLHYTDKKGRATKRTVWPVALSFFETAEMLAAWCETRQDFRHFRLDRIVSTERSNQRYPERRRILLAKWRALDNLD